MRLCSTNVSRRVLLRAAVCAAACGAVARNVDGAFAEAKRSKAEVKYQEYPHFYQRCEICAPFLPPDQCRTVVGPVIRTGWCKEYEGAG